MEARSRFKLQNAYQRRCIMIYLARADVVQFRTSGSVPKGRKKDQFIVAVAISQAARASLSFNCMFRLSLRLFFSR